MQSPQDPLRKIPTKHAPEARGDIGSSLKAARLKKGHTPEAVSQQTRIPKKYIDALESNRFDEFPALAYLRGFLKSYCDYLELDFEPLWRQAFSGEQPSGAGPSSAPPQDAAAAKAQAAPAPKPEAAAPAPKKEPAKPLAKPEPKAPEAAKPAPKPSAKKEPPAAPSPAAAARDGAAHGHGAAHDAGRGTAHAAPVAGSSAQATAAGFILLVAILGVLAAFWTLHGRAPATAQKAPAAPAELQSFAPKKEADLVIQLRDDAWLQVVVDGKKVFEGTAPKLSSQEWKASREAALRVTNPAALKLTLNGAPFKLPAPDASGVYRIEAP